MQSPRDENAAEFLNYVERKSAATLAVLRTGYDDLYDRANKLVSLLVAGCGATGALALQNFTTSQFNKALWAPPATLAIAWLAVAVYVAIRGMTTQQVSAGNGWKNIARYYKDCIASSGADSALELTRLEELRVEQERIEGYKKACGIRARTLDRAYSMVAVSPIAAIAAFIVSTWC